MFQLGTAKQRLNQMIERWVCTKVEIDLVENEVQIDVLLKSKKDKLCQTTWLTSEGKTTLW